VKGHWNVLHSAKGLPHIPLLAGERGRDKGGVPREDFVDVIYRSLPVYHDLPKSQDINFMGTYHATLRSRPHTDTGLDGLQEKLSCESDPCAFTIQ